MPDQTPNFYAVIPANVRYCQDIEMGAKLLYGEITSLTHVEGYCWASNKYFADLYGVDDRTIRRWLESLKKEKFIVIETDKNGIHWQRKIWISPEIKKMFTKGQKCPGGRTKMSGGADKNVLHNIKKNTKEEKETHPTLSKEDAKASCVGDDSSSFVSHGKFVKLKNEELDELVKEHGFPLVKDMINQINIYLASSGKKPYKDYAATIIGWIRRKQDQQKTYYGNKQANNVSKHQGLSRDKTERDPSRTLDFSKETS